MKKLITADSTLNKEKLVDKFRSDAGISVTDSTVATNKTVDGSFSIGDKIPDNPFKVKDESIEINYPIKVDDEVLEIDLSVLNEKEKEQFYHLLKKIQQPKAWKPKEGEEYWYISTLNGITSRTSDNYSYDDFIYSIGNYYRTEEEAEFALEKLKVETEIKRYIEANDPIKIFWGDKSNKYYLLYNHHSNKIGRGGNITTKVQGAIYFSNKLDWKTMVNTIGENRIKKYIFGVD